MERRKQRVSAITLRLISLPASSPFTHYRAAVRGSLVAKQVLAASRRDDALVAWLASQPDTKKQQFEESSDVETWASDVVRGADDVDIDSFQQVFAQLASN